MVGGALVTQNWPGEPCDVIHTTRILSSNLTVRLLARGFKAKSPMRLILAAAKSAHSCQRELIPVTSLPAI